MLSKGLETYQRNSQLVARIRSLKSAETEAQDLEESRKHEERMVKAESSII